jgi:putative membrane protein
MWDYHEGMGWWMIFGGILMVVFWGLVIALVVWAISRVTTHRSDGPSTPEKRSALDIAKERYARGEISKEQFEQIKKDLS